jgi:hypothetical protein
MTMLRKMRNTVAFGSAAQNEDIYTGESFGLQGQSEQSSGMIRSAALKRE